LCEFHKLGGEGERERLRRTGFEETRKCFTVILGLFADGKGKGLIEGKQKCLQEDWRAKDISEN
jgi:hypothetical protein